jgi:hypothetical protein
MVPVLALAFLHFGSVPVWAHSITGTGIQKMVPVPVLAFLCFSSVSVLARVITGTGIRKSSTNNGNLRIFVPTTIPLLEDYNTKTTTCDLILNCDLILSINNPPKHIMN